jgi:23S rRNA pseudouridine2605 synthase
LREKKDFGKKPGRRSKSEENEPAKVYRPRTAKLTTWEPKERFDDDIVENDSLEERKTVRSKSNDDQESFRKPRFDKDTGYSRGKSNKSSKAVTEFESKAGKKSITKKSESSYGKTRTKSYEPENGRKKYREKSSSDDYSGRSKHFESGSTRKEKPFGNEEKPFSKDSKRTVIKRSGEKGHKKFEKSAGYSDKPYRDNSKSTYGKRKDDKSFSKEGYKKDFKHSGFENDDVKNTRDSKKLQRKPPQIDSEIRTDKDGLIRLNKYIANSGLCSRREADEYIEKGYISVNGITIDQLGAKVKITDEIRFKGKDLDPERKVYILLNKPKDYITTMDDPHAKRTVMELIEGACQQRVYPVGRLDRNSTGLLLLTNDGELTKRLTHPSFMKKKVYEVGLDKTVRPEDVEAIANGIEIEGEMVKADAVEYIDAGDRSQLGIEIHSGQNRIVRRIFEQLGYRVQKLDRVYFAGLTKKNLPRGKWRFLSEKEVNMLKMNRF